ncbi:MAG: RnfABCDGE type electron transport complex subunit D [Alphaproteobacteria bacterium]|nr:RnfABCDGE type electron transport complex subunit D [Alphaproteobacteria bacterium]
MLKVSTAPHFYSPIDTTSIMRNVIIALIPAGIVAVLMFGLSALITMVTAVAGCVVMEYLVCRYMLKIRTTTADLSAVVTGLLLAYNLPCNMPIWMTLIGCFVAIVITKMAFGGIGKNIFNPALVGRVFLFVSFPVQMTTWQTPKLFDFLNTDVSTSATTLSALKHLDSSTSATMLSAQDTLPSYFDMCVGHIGGSMGEISTLALLLGLCWLLYKKVISWHIPFYYVGTFFALNLAFWLYSDSTAYEPLTQMLSGGLLLGAIFMATDYTTSPMSINGKIFFAVGCAVLTFVIRHYGSYPEGVSFAILIMNAFVPLIDMFFKPKIFGTGTKARSK